MLAKCNLCSKVIPVMFNLPKGWVQLIPPVMYCVSCMKELERGGKAIIRCQFCGARIELSTTGGMIDMRALVVFLDGHMRNCGVAHVFIEKDNPNVE